MFRRRSFNPIAFAVCTVLIVSICASPVVAARATQQRVGVVPALANDVMADEAAAVDDDLKTGLVSMSGFDVVDAAAMKAQLASAREFGLDCAQRDVECLAKLGVLAGVDLIVWSRTKASKPGELDLELTVVDVKATKETAHDRAPITATGGPARMAALKVRLTQLLRGPIFGTLLVETNVPGAKITVGGNLTTSMPITGLDPGSYQIAAEAQGYQRLQREAVVKAGNVTRETLTLVPTGSTTVAQTDPDPPVVDPPVDPPLVASSGGPNLLVLGGFAGFGVGVIGAALCGAGAAYAATIVTDRGMSTEDRALAQRTGQGLVIGASVLGAAALVGGGLGVAAMFME